MNRIITVTGALALVFLSIVCKKPPVGSPPATPAAPTGTPNGGTNTSYQFTTFTTDPDGDSVAIRFSWGDGDTSAWSASVCGGTAVTDFHSWALADTYLVRAQARDACNAQSEWSDPHPIAIAQNHAPDQPSMDEPGAVGAGETLHLDARLSDPDGDSVAVRICWGDGDTSVWSSFVASGEHVMLRHVYADTGAYLVQARAADRYGAASAWTDSSPTVIVWRPKWRHATDGPVESSPAVAADGTVYFGSGDGCLYALGPKGNQKWRYHIGSAVRSSPALAPDGTVYVGSDDGGLYAIGPDGWMDWRFQTGDLIRSSPALGADGTVYVGSTDGFLYAVGPSGTLKWSYSAGEPILSSAAVAADGTIYFGSNDNYLYALDTSGVLKWRYEASGNIESSPAIAADGTVYLECEGLTALDTNGGFKWLHDTYASVASPAIGADGTVYVGDEIGMFAVNPDGTEKWHGFVDHDVLSSVALASDGTIYVVGAGRLWAVDPSGGDWKWGYRIGDEVRSSPALAPDGTVYIGSDDGYLYAIRGNSPLADAPWPKFHHDARNTGRIGGGR